MLPLLTYQHFPYTRPGVSLPMYLRVYSFGAIWQPFITIINVSVTYSSDKEKAAKYIEVASANIELTTGHMTYSELPELNPFVICQVHQFTARTQ